MHALYMLYCRHFGYVVDMLYLYVHDWKFVRNFQFTILSFRFSESDCCCCCFCWPLVVLMLKENEFEWLIHIANTWFLFLFFLLNSIESDFRPHSPLSLSYRIFTHTNTWTNKYKFTQNEWKSISYRSNKFVLFLYEKNPAVVVKSFWNNNINNNNNLSLQIQNGWMTHTWETYKTEWMIERRRESRCFRFWLVFTIRLWLGFFIIITTYGVTEMVCTLLFSSFIIGLCMELEWKI